MIHHDGYTADIVKSNHAWYNLSLDLSLICSYFWRNFSFNVLIKLLL